MLKKLIIPIVLLFAFPKYGEGDGKDILEKMHDRYAGKWYKTLSFEQQTTRYNDEGEVVSDDVWYEALLMPDKLCIKFNDMDQGNGMLFRSDSLYYMQEGEIANSRPMIHPLLLLGFSVYDQPVIKTESALKALGFDLSKAHEKTYEGKEIYVIGAKEGDETSNQFWIEKDRMLFIKVVQNFGEGRIQTVNFENYQQVDGGWVATRVEFFNKDRLKILEVYSNIKTPRLKEKMFSPEAFKKADWIP